MVVRSLLVTAMEIAWLAIGVCAQSAEPPAPTPSVRATAAGVRNLLVSGCNRSAAFRSLGDRIGALGGIVQVEAGRCATRRACLLHWMVAAGPVRFLRIRVDERLRDEDAIVLVGHELQHAVEVLSDPGIDTAEKIYWRFRGLDASAAFETAAALETEATVRRQLRHVVALAGPIGCDAFATAPAQQEMRD